MPNPQILHIALNSPLRSLFDYKAPAKLDGNLSRGQRVEVPFGKRKAIGIIADISSHSDFDQSRLKTIIRVIDNDASISNTLLDFVLWAADYYHHPVGEALFHALPKRLRENQALGHKDFKLWKTTEKGQVIDPASLGRAQKQVEALALLQAHPEGLGQKTCLAMGLKNTVLKSLQDKSLITFAESTNKESLSLSDSAAPIQILRSSPLNLNEEQAQALSVINKNLEKYQCFLLNGITGSGKTEVYLQAIESVLKQGKQALVLVPEIGLTPQTLARFQQRFSCEIGAMHSGLSEVQRYKSWHKAKNNKAPIIIGTRSAIFADLPSLGLIVVDEEHDLSYKQQEGFRYSARDLAIVRAQREKIPVVLGSATPSFESLLNSENGRYENLELTKRASDAKAPQVQIVDIRGKELQGGLSQQALQHMRRHLENGQQVLVFINRRGYTPALICSECQWLATCPYCDARFTFHKAKNRLACHHCNFQQAPIKTCPKCHTGEMQALGQGTEKVEEVLAMHFKKVPVLRIDKDSTEKKNALQDRLDIVLKGDPCILVGTQMLTKGHHFPKVNMVCVVDSDQGFFSSDFRALERMGQTLTQITGRAGRESQHSEVLLQTELPDHPALQTLMTRGYGDFSKAALKDREMLNYPPYGHLCLIRADAINIDLSLRFLESVKMLMENTNMPNLPRILGPAPAPMQKRAGRHRAQLLLHSGARAPLHQILKSILPVIKTLPEQQKVRWSLDIDPLELF